MPSRSVSTSPDSSAREWAVVTDVFGTDLGLVAARADTVIVPHNLVGARWMRRETGWIPGVVSHLVRIRPPSVLIGLRAPRGHLGSAAWTVPSTE